MRSGAALAAVFSVIGLSLAPGAMAAPSLTGEEFIQHTSYTGAITGNCTAGTGGSTSYSMDFAGAASGPYPGTFTEHIEATVGPQNTVLPMGPFPGDGFDGGQGPDDFVPAGQLLTLTATFTIDSPAGDVTGTKTLTAVVPADSTHAGTCREWDNEDVGPPFGTLTGSYEDVRAFDISYEATITTPAGDQEDAGSTDLQARQGRATGGGGGTVFNVNDLGQEFESLDEDGDGDPDTADNCPSVANPGQENNDADAEGDACDADDDNDGDLDGADNCAFVANPGQENNDADGQGDACDADDDNDGDLDGADNCAFVANPGQENSDVDAEGDACDADDDNDGDLDGADNCPLVSNPGQEDADSDGEGDACDTDLDNDGDPDGADNCPSVANPGQENNDADAQGDACDADDDNDGVQDTGDACPTQAASTANGCPAQPPPADGDGDGVPDSSDACPTQAASTPNGCPAATPDTTAPEVPEEGSARLNARRLGVRIGPFPEAVTGTVSIRSAPFNVTRVGSARRTRLRFRPKAFQAPAGQPRTVRFNLTRKQARAVKKLRRLRLTVTVTARDAAGNETTTSFSITLRPRRR